MVDEPRVLPDTKIVHRSMADSTTDQLRRMIMLGELGPGERVTQDALSEILGVSTMPVREALLRLATEGLIEALPNRSFTIVRLSRSDFEDVYWTQGIIAGELTRRACRLDGARLAIHLRTLQDEFDFARQNRQAELMESINARWHADVTEAAQSSRLVVLLRTILRYTPQGVYSHIDGWVEETAQYQKTILPALEKGNCEEAGSIATSHLARASKLLIEHHPASAFWST
jgi:DNA-binding GntR family transcriptional regulator